MNGCNCVVHCVWGTNGRGRANAGALTMGSTSGMALRRRRGAAGEVGGGELDMMCWWSVLVGARVGRGWSGGGTCGFEETRKSALVLYYFCCCGSVCMCLCGKSEGVGEGEGEGSGPGSVCSVSVYEGL